MGASVVLKVTKPFHVHKRPDGVFELIGPNGKVWSKGKGRALIRRLAALCNKAHGYGALTKELMPQPEGVMLACSHCANAVRAAQGMTQGGSCPVCNTGIMSVVPPKE